MLGLSPSSAHWYSDLQKNVTDSMLTGNINDLSRHSNQASYIVNLQAAFSDIWPGALTYNGLAFLVTGSLGLIWLISFRRMRSNGVDNSVAIAAMACLTLLPVYHRFYDDKILLLTVPVLSILLADRRWLGYVALPLLLLETGPAVKVLDKSITMVRALEFVGPHSWFSFLIYREQALFTIALAVLFVGWFYWQASRPQRFGVARVDSRIPASQ